MPKEKLIALRPLAYATRRLQAGDAFEALPRDARVLKAIGKAREDYDAPVKAALVAAALVPKPIPLAPSIPVDLDALRAEAVAAGASVDGRWGERRLREEIEAAKTKFAEPTPVMTIESAAALIPQAHRMDDGEF